MEKETKKKLLIIVPIIVFSLIVIFLIGYFIKFPSFLFPKASTYDITGRWKITTTITNPTTTTQTQYANLVQSETGRVTGTVTDQNGGKAQPITGQVNGNQFQSDPLLATGKYGLITYEVTINLVGTINEGSTQIAGNLSGQITKPTQSPVAGTFIAVRLDSPLPTPTSAPTTSSTPTVTPTASGTTPTPTIAYRTPIPGYTNPPIPVSGAGLPTIFGLGGGILLLFLATLLIF